MHEVAVINTPTIPRGHAQYIYQRSKWFIPPRRSTPGMSTLRSPTMVECLPIEVLNLIASNVRITAYSCHSSDLQHFQLADVDFRALRVCRLVCRLLNAVAEPVVFGSLSFGGESGKPAPRLVQRLETLATGTTLYTHWAHTLLIEQGGLHPSLNGSNSSEERVQMALQDVLSPAIGSLRNLKRAWCVLSSV